MPCWPGPMQRCTRPSSKGEIASPSVHPDQVVRANRVASLKGAFKTPTVREAANTAPYFHDGSARTLEELVDFYAKGGIVKTNLSKSMKELQLTKEESAQLVAFIHALSSPVKPFVLPVLPR